METLTPRGQKNETGTLSKCSKRKTNKKQSKAAVFVDKETQATSFRRFYDMSDLPVSIDNGAKGNKLKWAVEISKLDYRHYLPLFFEGMRETAEPYGTIATLGMHDMLTHAPPSRVLGTVPQLIIPIKKALDTRNRVVMVRAIKAIQSLVESDEMVGEALVPYYRQILPMLSYYKSKNINTGDGIVYGQNRHDNIGDLVEETLGLLERTGGDDAFINIKYMVPTYESCMLN